MTGKELRDAIDDPFLEDAIIETGYFIGPNIIRLVLSNNTRPNNRPYNDSVVRTHTAVFLDIETKVPVKSYTNQ